ncbi:MAG: hypothetical protein KJ060_14185 [Candidatus Hydrogenedentes bacterium]|nr:hypothetical protein [Candidatus Hydrogenedentota bacterium]
MSTTFPTITTRIVLAWSIGILSAALAYAQDRFDGEPIRYTHSKPDNPVSRLQDAINQDRETLQYDSQFGYLRSILAKLDIPVESQMLVFSKTSFQSDLISPETPRAIYFNDDVYIGAVQNGSVIEVSVADPNLGAVFYTLSQNKTDTPVFVRKGHECLQCHASNFTRDYPGHIVRSVYPDADGFPIVRAGSYVTTHESPFEERWGGWYVTGTHGDARHMGNVIATKTEHSAELDSESGANQTTLPAHVRADGYLTAHSDIVALMVLEHQVHMHNLITRADFETRLALRDEAVMDEALHRDTETLSESAQHRIASVCDKLVDYMLFVDEPELDDPIQGTSGGAVLVASIGPGGRPGRALRGLVRGAGRVCGAVSYLIYSEQFDGLPDTAKDYIYQRLWDILTAKIDTADYLHLTNYTSRAIREILLDTKPNLPAYWHSH